MSGDITAKFSDQGTDCACKTAYCLNTGYAGCSVLTIIRKMREVAPFQHSGSFADMDMLEIGNGNMTLAEQQTHMSFWAALKSPLIIGADISKLSNESLSVLMNKDVIDVSQDSLGQAALFIPELSVEYTKQVWAGSLSQGRTVILVLNEVNQTTTLSIPLKQISGLQQGVGSSARELWSGSLVQIPASGTLNVSMNAHQTKMYII